MHLDGHTALITGGGRGIGAATARMLAEAGAAIVVSARSTGEIEQVADTIREGGGRADSITCDVTDANAVRAMAHEAASRVGVVDILVNNAGMAGSSPFERQTLDEFNQIMAVNATGAFLCMQAFLPAMREGGWGRVVNIASVAGLHGARYIAAYTASKHALVGLTRAVAAEYAQSGVTVNAVCPSYVDTHMTNESIRRITERTGRSKEEALAAIMAQTAQGRLIQPDEIAHAVLALCDDRARGINGQTTVIDGGG